jgi:chemotaxis family two-component system response regulator Rcp1
MRQRRPERPVRVLLVDDNPADARLMECALKTAAVQVVLSIVLDGFEALAYVRRQGAFLSAARPDLIMLDLNLPGKDGYQVLRELRSDPGCRDIPVLIYSGSAAPNEVKRAYELGGNGYVQKPSDLDELMAVVASIESFWLRTALLPSL